MEKNLFLADVIFIFHFGIVLFILFAPFFKIPAILILHIVFSISLLLHWYTNSNMCSLTLMESQLRGLSRTDTFTHKLIAPMYDISLTDMSSFAYIITYIMLFISIYFLYNSAKFKNAMKCYSELKINENMTFTDKIKAYFDCLKPLLFYS